MESVMLKSKRISIVWDLDGTIVDSTNLGFEASNVILNNHGFNKISISSYKEGSKFQTLTRLLWHIGKDITNDYSLGKQLESEFDNYYIELVNTSCTPLFPGIVSVLSKLQNDIADQYKINIIMGVLSNAASKYVEKVIEVHKLSKYFIYNEKIQGYGPDSPGINAAKPKPDGLIYICNEFECERNTSIYIGDSITDGMAAKSAGLFR